MTEPFYPFEVLQRDLYELLSWTQSMPFSSYVHARNEWKSLEPEDLPRLAADPCYVQDCIDNYREERLPIRARLFLRVASIRYMEGGQ